MNNTIKLSRTELNILSSYKSISLIYEHVYNRTFKHLMSYYKDSKDIDDSYSMAQIDMRGMDYVYERIQYAFDYLVAFDILQQPAIIKKNWNEITINAHDNSIIIRIPYIMTYWTWWLKKKESPVSYMIISLNSIGHHISYEIP